MKKALLPIIVLVLILAGTIGLYCLLLSIFNWQAGPLFYINMVATCVAETLLFLNVPMWSGKSLLTVTNVTISRYTNVYAIVLFAWTLLFTIFASAAGGENLKIYFLGLLIISLIYVAVCGVATIGASRAEGEYKEQQVLMDKKQNLVQFVQAIDLDIQASLEKEDSDWKDDFFRLYRLALDKLASLPNGKMSSNPTIAQKVEDSLTEIATMCEQLATSEDPSALKADITNRLNRLVKYITTVKTL